MTPTNKVVATANASTGTGTPYVVAYGTRDFFLYNNGEELDSATATATCATGTTWSESDAECQLNAVPTVTSPTATSITASSAILGAHVTSLGIPAAISQRGTCWSLSANPGL